MLPPACGDKRPIIGATLSYTKRKQPLWFIALCQLGHVHRTLFGFQLLACNMVCQGSVAGLACVRTIAVLAPTILLTCF